LAEEEVTMKGSSREILLRLGAGQKIAEVCAAFGTNRPEFDTWWRAEAAGRVPPMDGSCLSAVRRPVRIDRDGRGIPSIFAENDWDLFFGFGYAMAQDRLFQLDFLRRKGTGRLAEILGPGGADLDYLGRFIALQSVLEWDLLARTVGLRRIAECEWQRLPDETRQLLAAFSAGINALMDQTRDRPPIELDLLDYRPEPWSPVDSLTIEVEFRWYLTGRFPVLVLPEMARQTLGDGPLYRAFLEVESDAESILPAGTYPHSHSAPVAIGSAMNDPQEGEGSNNWVVAGSRTATGKPLLASDPHIALEAVSCWYPLRLCGGSFHVAGMAYAGMPAVMFGRNERVAWGCTNNICSQRDLYQERTDPHHPNCFLFDGHWEPARRLEEVIAVKGCPSVHKSIVFSRNGPIVNEVLPPPVRGGRPVSLEWLGAYEGGWLTALLAMNRARSAAEFREATKPWHVPTWALVYAEVDGHTGFQAVGKVPVRDIAERGYRPGWDPRHQWQGLIPFEGMPHWEDPPRGWVATANNRPAPDDYPYPLSGCWSHGLRAERIHELLAAWEQATFEVFRAMQADTLSPRARRCLPGLIRLLEGEADERWTKSLAFLRRWDCRMEVDRVGATLFDVFFTHWTRAVAAERFPPDTAGFLAEGAAGPAAGLLLEDRAGWFAPGRRQAAARAAFTSALSWLANRLGPDVSQWTWGRLHILPLRHFLSGRGDLGVLLDHGGAAVPGDFVTVCSTGGGAAFEARTGAGYRMITDLASSPPTLWAVDAQSQSGHPGSPHYADQLADWLAGRYHPLSLDSGQGCEPPSHSFRLHPQE
jgi:penicillin amidase